MPLLCEKCRRELDWCICRKSGPATIRPRSWSTYCANCRSMYGDSFSSETDARQFASNHPYCSDCEDRP